LNPPFALLGAVALNVLIGMVCLVAGTLLVGSFVDGMLDNIRTSPAGAIAMRATVFGLPIYGALGLIGANATWRGSAWGWWLVLAVDLGGIVILGWAVLAGGPDYFKAGIVILGLAVLLLVLPPTRAARRS
jgi:hypothetical protein